jgi:hypothetical protein
MPLHKIRPVPKVRVYSVEGTAEALRKEIAAHNLRAAGIAVLSFVVAAGLWTILYLVYTWLCLLVGTAASTETLVYLPAGFKVFFVVVAGCSLGYAWWDHRISPNARPRDHKTPWEVASDIVLALPRLTLSVWGTLRATLWLSGPERKEASTFLHRLAKDRRIPLHNVPLDTADPEARFRILLALQLLETIEIYRDEREPIIRLNSSRPDTLGLPERSSGPPGIVPQP